MNLGNFDPIGNVFEEFSLVAAGLVLWAIFSPAGSSIARRQSFFVLLFGICPISFGIVHIIDMPGLLGAIPGWLPPTRMFWAYATTLGFFGTAVSILTGIMAPLASRLLTAEILIFELLFWIPNLFAGPSNHFNWAGNAISYRHRRRQYGSSPTPSAQRQTPNQSQIKLFQKVRLKLGPQSISYTGSMQRRLGARLRALHGAASGGARRASFPER